MILIILLKTPKKEIYKLEILKNTYSLFGAINYDIPPVSDFIAHVFTRNRENI